jgi:hypothetical protein
VSNPFDAIRDNTVWDEFLCEQAVNMPCDVIDLFALWRAARCPEPYPTPWWREHAPRDEEDAPEDDPALADIRSGLEYAMTLDAAIRKTANTAVFHLLRLDPAGFMLKAPEGLSAWTAASSALGAAWCLDDAPLKPVRAALFRELRRDPVEFVRRAPGECKRLVVSFAKVVTPCDVGNELRHLVREMVDHYGDPRGDTDPETIRGRILEHAREACDSKVIAVMRMRVRWIDRVGTPIPYDLLLRDAYEFEGLDWRCQHQAEAAYARIERTIADVVANGY